MRKIRAIKYIGLVLFFAYTIAIILTYFTSFVGDFDNILFSILLAVLSLFTCFKGTMIRSFSTLWFSVTLILYAILIIVFEITKISYDDYIYLFAFLPIITSLVFICFKKFHYIKVLIINLSIAIPVLISKTTVFNLWLNIGCFMCFVILGIFIAGLLDGHKERANNG